MAGRKETIRVDLEFNANTERAKRQMVDLQHKLNAVVATSSRSSQVDAFTKDVEKSAIVATKLQANLTKAFNVDTGKLNLNKFNQEMQRSKMSVEQYKDALMSAGPVGEQAFKQLAKSIATAETPLLRVSDGLKKLGVTLSNTIRWQISASVIQGFISALSTAYGYAQDLNKSLNDIRIVTEYNVETMDKFAEKANKMAKALRTTTNEYAKASLIYFQQGLSMKEVEERTNATIKLAQVTGKSVEQVSNQLTAVWNNFDNGTKSLEYYVDVITALGAATASSSEEITQGLEKFAAIAETVGLSYEYATAALATVTSETRQSADIVGTAFKTLFARIQDLELGKTLEDGVTLGQYSAAMESIGVSVLDVTGNVKDMNEILNEMGKRWDTISKAQQISLAQNVAGVRQYTQLIALMDNWDEFQQNVQIAESSEGSLSRQQEIWAESWEAANEKVRASLETIYQLLLDDDTFISILNFTSDFVDAIGTLVEGMGGLSTILLLVSSLLLKTFSADIADGIDDITFSVRSLTKAGRAENERLKEEMALQLKQNVSKTGIEAFTGEAGVSQALMQQEYNRLIVSEKLNKTQKLQAEMYLNQNLALTEQVELLAKKAREAQRVYKTEKLSLDKDQKDLLDQRRQALFTSQVMTDIGPDYSDKVNKAFGDDAQIDQMIPAIEELEERVRTMGISAEEVAPRLAESFGEQSTQKVKEYASAVQKAKEAAENYQKASTPENASKVKDALAEVRKAYDGVEKSIQPVLKATNKLPQDAKKAAALYAESQAEVAKAASTATSASERFAEGLKKVIDKQKSSTQGLIEVASGITSLVFAFNSFKSAWDALNNEDLTWGEKLISVFSALTMAILMAVKGFKALNLENLKNVGTNLLNILSLGKLKKAIEAKTVAEEADKKNGSGDTPEGIATTKAQTEATKEATQATVEKIAVEEMDKANEPQPGDIFDYIDGKSGKKGRAKAVLNKNNEIVYQDTKNSSKTISEKWLKAPKGQTAPPVSTTAPPAGIVPPVPATEALGAGSSGALAGLGSALATAGIIAAIIAAIAVTIISLKKGFEQVEKEAQTAEEHAKNLKQAFTDTKQQFDDLMSTSSSHEEALKALDEMQKGTVKYTQALNDANAQALELINAYEELEYHWENGAIVFDNMEEVLEKESAKVAEALGRSELARASAIDKRSRADMVNFARNTLGDTWAGYDSNFLGIGLGNSNQSESERVLQKLADMYNERGEVIFENFAATLRGAELGIDDYGLIYALEENAKAVMDLTKQIARDDTGEENAWKNAYIQKNNLGDNPNAEAIASQAWKDLSDENGTGAQAANTTKQTIKNNSKADNAKWYLISVLGEKEEDIVKVGSGWGSGWMGKNYYIKDTGGAGVTIKYRPDESSEWVDLYGEKNAFAHTDLNKQLIESEVMKALSAEDNISSYSGNISTTKKELRAAGFASDDRLDDVINEFYDTGTVNLTDYSGTEVEALKANLNKVSDVVVRQALEEAISGYWDAIRGANINKTQAAQERLGETNANELLALLQQYEMSQEAFEEYVKQFEEYGTAAEDVAKLILEVGSQQKKLGEIYSKSAGEILIGVNAIKQGQDASPKAVAAIKDIQNTFKEWFGADLDFDYLVNHFELVQQVIEGDAEALKELRHQAAFNLVDDLNVQHQAVKDFLKSFIEVSAGAEHFQGEILSNSNVLMDFNKLLEQGQIESEELKNILANEGWQLDIEINPVTGKESVKQVVYVGYQGLDDTALEKESERYHYIRETLSDLESYYNRIDKAKSRAFGANRLALLDQERNAIQSLIDTQSTYLKQIKDNIPNDANALRKYGAEFDNYGRVKNADALLAQFKDDSNFKTILSQYEETLNLLESEREKYEDLINQSLDVKLEKIQYTVDLKVSIADDSLTYLEYLGKSLKEDFEGVKKAIELATKKLPYLQSQLNAQKEGLEGTLNASGLAYDQINRLLAANAELTAADFTDKNGNIVSLSADAIESLRKYRDGLIEYEETVRETFESISKDMISLVDENDNKINDKINLINNLGDMAKTVRDIIDLMGVKTLGVTSQVLDAIYEVSVTAAQASAQAAKKSLDMSKQDLEEAKSARAQAQLEGASEEVLAEWDKTIEHLTKKVQDKESDMVKSLQDALQAIAEAYKKQTEDIGRTFENMMTKGLGFQTLNDMYELRKQEDDRFLDDYQKIYELSKLNRDVINSIDNTDNIHSKQQLKELQEEINYLQEHESEMTQYQVDELRARYELRLAEIALEEAQNAKSQVRMTRDSEGNYSYVYTADQNNVDKAQQNVEDKLYALQKLQQEYQKEIQDRIMELPQQYRDMMLQIATDETLTEEERKNRMEETTKFYQGQYEYLAQQLGIAIDHSNYLYNNDWANYSRATGYKMSEQDEWISSFDKTIISQITGYGDLEGAINNFKNTSEQLVSSLNAALSQYQENTANVFDKVGISMEDFANMAASSASKAKEAIVGEDGRGGLAQDIANLAAKGEDGFKSLVDSAHKFYEKYDKEIKSFVSSNNALIESIGQVIAKYAELVAAEQDISINPTKPFVPEKENKPPDSGKKVIVNLADNRALQGMKDTEFAEGTSIGFKEIGSGKYLVYDKITGEEYGWTDNPTTRISNGSTESGDWTGLNPYDSSEYEREKAEEEQRKRKEWEEDTKKNPTYVEQTFFGANGKKYYKMNGINWLVNGEDLEKLQSYYNGNYSIYNKKEIEKKSAPELILNIDAMPNVLTGTLAPNTEDSKVFGSWQLSKKVQNVIVNGKLPVTVNPSNDYESVQTYYLPLKDLAFYDTGGYTGSWDSSGRLAMLHQKEIVLNARDTENFLAAIDIVRDIVSVIDLRAAAQQSALSQITAASVAPTVQTLQQEVTIHAEFPNATQRTEIEAAFDTLLNRASQFANRKNK